MRMAREEYLPLTFLLLTSMVPFQALRTPLPLLVRL